MGIFGDRNQGKVKGLGKIAISSEHSISNVFLVESFVYNLLSVSQLKVKGLGKIAISSEHSISNVFLVESFVYNLLSVSQLCNMGYNCLFTNVDVSVFRRSDGSLAFKGVLDGKLYLVDFLKEEADLDACLIAKTSMGWLWHRRLAHVGMKNLHKLLKGEHVLGLAWAGCGIGV